MDQNDVRRCGITASEHRARAEMNEPSRGLQNRLPLSPRPAVRPVQLRLASWHTAPPLRASGPSSLARAYSPKPVAPSGTCLAEQSGRLFSVWTARLSAPDATMLQTSLILSAFLTGLAGGVHCVGMCGGFALAAARPGRRGVLTYHLGRIVTYSTLGAAAGAFGAALVTLQWIGSGLAAALLVWFSLQLAGVRTPSWMRSSLAHRALAAVGQYTRPMGSFGVGLSTALLPCGLVYAALAIPVASGSVLTGVLAMAAFGVGTSPLLSLMGVIPFHRMKHPALRVGLAAVILVAGLWTIVHRLPQPDQEVPDCCANVYEDATFE